MSCLDNQINYTFIIPHKNTPDYLQRCLDSIPVRDDVQVIVVDDNSDSEIVDFAHFPRWDGVHFEYYLTKEGRGAGYARNIGLEHAIGKWLLFADADDFLLPAIDGLLDKYVDSDADIIYFRPKSVMADDLTLPSDRADGKNWMIDAFLQRGDDACLKLGWHAPWGKFIRHEIAEGIRFEEIRYSNDSVFSVRVACRARRIAVCEDAFYVITRNDRSLTSNFMNKPGELECRVNAHLRVFQIACDSGMNIASLIEPLKSLTHMLHYRHWPLYVQCLHALNSVGISTWQMLREKYSYARRWDRWKGYVNTYLHIHLQSLKNEMKWLAQL